MLPNRAAAAACSRGSSSTWCFCDAEANGRGRGAQRMFAEERLLRCSAPPLLPRAGPWPWRPQSALPSHTAPPGGRREVVGGGAPPGAAPPPASQPPPRPPRPWSRQRGWRGGVRGLERERARDSGRERGHTQEGATRSARARAAAQPQARGGGSGLGRGGGGLAGWQGGWWWCGRGAWAERQPGGRRAAGGADIGLGEGQRCNARAPALARKCFQVAAPRVSPPLPPSPRCRHYPLVGTRRGESRRG